MGRLLGSYQLSSLVVAAAVVLTATLLGVVTTQVRAGGAPTKLVTAPPYNDSSAGIFVFCEAAEGAWEVPPEPDAMSGQAEIRFAHTLPTSCLENEPALLPAFSYSALTDVTLATGQPVEAQLSYRINEAVGHADEGSVTYEFLISFDLTDQFGPGLPAVAFTGGSQPAVIESCTASVGQSCALTSAFATGEHTIAFAGEVDCGGAPSPCALPDLRTFANVTVHRSGEGSASGSVVLDLEILQLSFGKPDSGGSINGLVTEEGTGQPLPNVCVYVWNDGPGSLAGSAATDETGAYTVIGLPPGDYNVLFRHCEFPAPHWSEWYNNHTDALAADVVTLGKESKASGIDAALEPLCAPSCPKPTLRVASAVGMVGSDTPVDLDAVDIRPPGLGAWTIDIAYDPTILTPQELTCVPQAAGLCRVAGISGLGLERDATLATVAFSCESQGASALAAQVVVLSDATVGDPQPVDANVLDGGVTCEQPSQQPGDVSCDNEVTAIDSLFLLQFVAELLASLPCPDAGDVNGDGIANVLDAALILQIVAGLL